MKTGLTVADIESLVYSEAEKIQGLKSSTDENVITFSKTMELDRELNYNSRRPEQSNNAIIARIEPVMRSRNTEATVRELNEKIKAAGITAEYKAAEINTNGKLSRELAGAVTQADFAREQNHIIFGDAALRNSPAEKYSEKPRNIPAPPKAEKSGTEIRHSSGIAAGDSPAGNDADIIGESLFYKENTPSLAVKTEVVHHTEDTRFNAADSATRKSFIGNESAYSGTANSADNAPPTEAELRTLFRQPATDGMQQRKPSRHILPCMAERTAIPAKKLDEIHHSHVEIYPAGQSKCLLPNRKRPQGLRG